MNTITEKLESVENTTEPYYLVNGEGEVVETIEDVNRYVKLGAGDRVLRYNSTKKLNTTKKLSYHFIKINFEYYPKIGFSVPLVNILLPYIHHSSCELIYENGVYVTPLNLSRSIKMSLSYCRRSFRKLEELDVIKRCTISKKRVIYYFNPYIATRGARVEVNTLNMFSESSYREVK